MPGNAAADGNGGVKHRVQLSRTGGVHSRTWSNDEGRRANVAAQPRRELVVDALLHPCFPLRLGIWTRRLSQPREMPARPIGVVEIEQVAVRLDDGITVGPRLAVERLKGRRRIQGSEADARPPSGCGRELVSEGD